MPSPLNTPTRRRFTGPPGSRDSPKNTYSDRFIPNRLSTNLEEAFDMMENRDSSLRENRGKHERHDSSSSMDGLLRSELLGHAVFGPGDLQAPSPARRESGGLFKYRSPHVSDFTFSPNFRNTFLTARRVCAVLYIVPPRRFVGVPVFSRERWKRCAISLYYAISRQTSFSGQV
jgi:hypothetical protein